MSLLGAVYAMLHSQSLHDYGQRPVCVCVHVGMCVWYVCRYVLWVCMCVCVCVCVCVEGKSRMFDKFQQGRYTRNRGIVML